MSEPGPPSGIWTEIVSFFSSVRLTIVLLLTLAATSVIGTLIPQNAAPARYFMQYGEFWFRFFSVFDFFDMYHSWWFQTMLILLAVNIVVCSIQRFRATWSVLFPQEHKGSPDRFRKSGFRVEKILNVDLQQVRKTLQHRLGKRARGSSGEAGTWGVFWEHGRKSRLGVYVVHLSVVLLLIGGLMGSMWGFDGSVSIPEGEKADTIQLAGKNIQHRLDFAVRCDAFQIRFYENGMPSEYRSTLTILENGSPVLTRDILVNDPLQYKGVTIYQASYGTVPSKKAVFEFTSRDSGMVYQQAVDVGQDIVLQENLGTFSLKEFVPNFRFKGHDIGETFLAVITPETGAPPVEIAIPVQFPSFDKMRKGPVSVSVADVKTRYATGLQVSYDPGVWVVYAGFLLMIAGCYITFFRSHRQVYVEISEIEGKTKMQIFGITNKNRLGMERWLRRFGDRIASEK